MGVITWPTPGRATMSPYVVSSEPSSQLKRAMAKSCWPAGMVMELPNSTILSSYWRLMA